MNALMGPIGCDLEVSLGQWSEDLKKACISQSESHKIKKKNERMSVDLHLI